jgi:hypothetical protein
MSMSELHLGHMAALRALITHSGSAVEQLEQ